MHNRRTLLRSLATLPLIGGSVAILGQATAAAAVPVSDWLLLRYEVWLDLERSNLRLEQWGRIQPNDIRAGYPIQVVYRDKRTAKVFDHYHLDDHGFGLDLEAPPSTRAAIVLSAVGCALEGGR